MPPRSRYAVDPSLTAQANSAQQWGQPQPPHHQQDPTFAPGFGQQSPPPQQFGQLYGQQQQPAYQQPVYQQQPYVNPKGPQLHNVPDERHRPAPTGPYAPVPGQHQQQHHVQPLAPTPQPQQYNYPPQNHIPPPPHAAGPTLTGPRVRIDPSQVPDPIEAQELDQNLYDDEDFLSCDTKGLIPLAVTDYRGVDQGNSLPRHLRSTLPTIPSTSQLLDTTGLPFGLVVQPFAPLRYDEAPVPLVTNWVAGESAFDAPPPASGDEEPGPPRCDKCRGYINPWVRFTQGGHRWQCNLCGHETNLPTAYFSPLTPMGQRLDHNERPELQCGTVDFPVPREYWAEQPKGSLLDADDASLANLAAAGDALATTGHDLLGALQSSLGQTPTRGPTPTPSHNSKGNQNQDRRRLRRPMPLGRVFVIDVSVASVQKGIVREVCEAVRKALYGEAKDGDDGSEDEEIIGKGERVAFVTVGQTVGFWNIRAALDRPQLLVVSDLDDMFCPIVGGFLADPIASRSQIEDLLTMIPSTYEAQPDGMQCAVGPSLKGALDGLRGVGGQINLFISGLPVLGPGHLKARDDPSLTGTDKEKALFSPTDDFWRKTADEMAEAGVGVNTFVFPDQSMDLANVGIVSAVSGGETFFHPKFQPVRDRNALQSELQRVVCSEVAYNATVRIRCSNGLRVAEYGGNFLQRSLTDIEFGTLDPNKAFTATIKHEGHRLDDRQTSYIQVATLYTSANGDRRVRLLNLALPVSGMIGNVFRFADFDAVVSIIYKAAVSELPYRKLRDIRKVTIERANRILLNYRKHCAPSVPAGQLILPEGFKLLPLYTLCMIKSKPLKGGNVVPDVRAHYMRAAKGASVAAIMTLLYPRILAIHDLADSFGFPGANGRLRIPRFQRASYAYMVAEGAYLLSNGEIAMLWFGGAVSPQILDDLYGVQSLEELDTRITRLPKLPTLLSTQVRNILTHLERLTGHTLPVLAVRQDRDGLEIEYANQLVEDSNNDALSYTDFLMTAHKAITNEIQGKSDGWKAPWH